jgi:nitrate/nitrite transporter NarK
MFGDMKNKNLIYFSWFITISAFIFVYGGFHPDKIAKGRLLNFSLFLVLFAHLPAIFDVLFHLLKKEVDVKNLMFLVLSLLIQCYMLTT